MMIKNFLKFVTCFIFIISAFFTYVYSNEIASEQVKKVFNIDQSNYVLYVNKVNFMMYVYNRDMQIIESFNICYGLNTDKKAKLYAGDNRTPEGIYKVTEILSMDAEKNTIAFKKLRDMNSIYFKARDGHYKFGKKNIDLGNNVYGPRFFKISYPDQNDISRYKQALKSGLVPMYNGKILPIGDGIAIHGNNDEASIGKLASSGCIRMHNGDIIKLDKYVKLNTPVIISKE